MITTLHVMRPCLLTVRHTVHKHKQVNSCHTKTIYGLICKLANYIFITFKTLHLSPQWSDFDDLCIKILRRATEFDLHG